MVRNLLAPYGSVQALVVAAKVGGKNSAPAAKLAPYGSQAALVVAAKVGPGPKGGITQQPQQPQQRQVERRSSAK